MCVSSNIPHLIGNKKFFRSHWILESVDTVFDEGIQHSDIFEDKFEDKLLKKNSGLQTNPYTQAKPHHTHSFNCHRRGGEGCAAPDDSYLVFAAHLFGVVEWDVVTRRAGRLALRYLQIKT